MSRSNNDQVSGWDPWRSVALLTVLPVAIRTVAAERPDWWPLWGAIATLVIVAVVANSTRKAYLTRNAGLIGDVTPINNTYRTKDGYFLTREQYLARNPRNALDWSGPTRVRGLVAGALLLAFLLALPPTARHEHNIWLILLTGMLLWASTLTVLRFSADYIGCAPLFLSGSAGGEVALLAAIGALRDGGILVGTGLLLAGMAGAVFGAAMRLFDQADASGNRKNRSLFKSGWTVFGLSLLLAGASMLVFTAVLLRDGPVVAGIFLLFFATTPCIIGGMILEVRRENRRYP
ncbi:MAG TPA: hypothetical protein VJ851_01120 [Jatrophihabitans sp.]|nr:hypothetical protein [Jatrophihabitans sp.]